MFFYAFKHIIIAFYTPYTTPTIITKNILLFYRWHFIPLNCENSDQKIQHLHMDPDTTEWVFCDLWTFYQSHADYFALRDRGKRRKDGKNRNFSLLVIQSSRESNVTISGEQCLNIVLKFLLWCKQHETLSLIEINQLKHSNEKYNFLKNSIFFNWNTSYSWKSVATWMLLSSLNGVFVNYFNLLI